MDKETIHNLCNSMYAASEETRQRLSTSLLIKGAETIKELSDEVEILKEKLEAANQSLQELQSCRTTRAKFDYAGAVRAFIEADEPVKAFKLEIYSSGHSGYPDPKGFRTAVKALKATCIVDVHQRGNKLLLIRKDQ